MLLDLATDYRLFLKRKPIDHTQGFILRLIGLTPSIIFLPGNIIYGALMEGAWYLILFNGLFGIAIGQNFFYIGNTSTLDKAMRKIGVWAYVIQYTVCILFTALFLIFKNDT